MPGEGSPDGAAGEEDPQPNAEIASARANLAGAVALIT
jgi:hypothetical protein